VNVESLTSDQSMRDSHIQTLGLESAQFPHATFVLLVAGDPCPTNATSGAEISVSLRGALTIHGVTKTVSIPVQARLTGSQIEVVGAITFPWGEFGMQAPNIGGFVTVDGTAPDGVRPLPQAQLTERERSRRAWARRGRQRREARA